MKWHFDLTQHTSQFGFALTVAYVNPRELDGTSMEGTMACSECGVDAPFVELELTLLVWTVRVTTHAE